MGRPLSILFCSSEVVPYAKTGGLADVAGALPAALGALGHDVRVVTPLYGCINPAEHGLTMTHDVLDVPLRGRGTRASLWEGVLPGTQVPVPVYFVDCPGFFDRPGLYQEGGVDYDDNLDRFAFFSRACLQLCSVVGFTPDVVHCNDWQTALAPVYLRTLAARDERLAATRSLMTIHNLARQGNFVRADLPRTGLGWELYTLAGLEYYGGINVLKGGIQFADGVSTVSPTYSREIQAPEYGAGLDGVLRARGSDLVGILNGVDYDAWDPSGDPHIAETFDVTTLEGKAACKEALQQECDLPHQQVPLFGMISQLDVHRGLDLMIEVIPELLQLDVQLVILGTGQPEIEERLAKLARTHPGKMALRLAFDAGLAHRILAGADVFVMPSRFEPCGLSQMYSMRYGTIPVVRRTGGLADTVVDYLPSTIKAKTATGFHFVDVTAAALLKALLLASTVYASTYRWRQLVETAMAVVFGWGASAEAYVRLYRSLERRREER